MAVQDRSSTRRQGRSRPAAVTSVEDLEEFDHDIDPMKAEPRGPGEI
jgi:hypothetical protein